MSDHCSQTDKLNAIHSTLHRLEDSNERLLDIMERMSEQGAFIKALQETAIRYDKAINNLYGRINQLEVQSAGEQVRVGFIMSGISAGTAVVTSLLIKLWKG